LERTALLGVKTNLAFLERVVRHAAFLAGDTDTGFIERHRAELLPPGTDVPLEALVAAAARVFTDERRAAQSAEPSPWADTGGWRLNQPALRRMEFKTGDRVFTVDAVLRPGHAMVTVEGRTHQVAVKPPEDDRLQISLDDETYFARVVRLGERLSAVTPRGRHD